MEEPSKQIRIRIQAPQTGEEKREEKRKEEKALPRIEKPLEKPVPEKRPELLFRQAEKKAAEKVPEPKPEEKKPVFKKPELKKPEEKKSVFLTPRPAPTVLRGQRGSYSKIFGFLLLLSFIFSGASLYLVYALK